MSPRNSKVKVAQNQATMVQGLKEGKKQVAIAAELRLTPETISRNLAKLREGFTTASREEFSVYVKQQVDLLTKAIEEVWQGTLPPEAANSIRGLMDSIARLTGSNAPSKSISANVNVNPEHSEDYLLFREACAGLSEEQIHDVRLYAKALPRTWVAPPIEVNFPPMKALPEATDEAQ